MEPSLFSFSFHARLQMKVSYYEIQNINWVIIWFYKVRSKYFNNLYSLRSLEYSGSKVNL